MTGCLNVTIPLIDDARKVFSIEKIIAITIMEYQNQFTPLFERLIELGSSGVTVTDDSLMIDESDVAVKGIKGVACGAFDSDYFSGCKDMRGTDDHYVKLPFEIKNNNLVFAINLPPAWVLD
jgi:hypothetical protein